MDRRKAMKVAAGTIIGGGVGLITLTNAFKPKIKIDNDPQLLEYEKAESSWKYASLDPAVTAELAYKYYSEGSCMYAVVKSVISQLAEIIGDSYTSFPINLFKYGHGGVGGYGSVCGALNGAAALIGLLIDDKNIRDKIIADIFKWYEKEPLPEFKPENSTNEFVLVKSISNSVLCHASNTNWCKTAGLEVNSEERKERCRRLAGDVSKKVTTALNEIYFTGYTTNINKDETVGTCLTCHGSEGKVNNTSAKMTCNSCHTESVGHRVFSDIHYKLMK